MLIETVELTMSHVDLGHLTEKPAMTLFGDAVSHRIVMDTGNTLSDVTDVEGHLLYPGYFHTHLRVPPRRLLSSFHLWDRISVGVDVRTFGGIIIDAAYVIGGPGEVADDPDLWSSGALPTMSGNQMFVVEDSRLGEQQAAVPKRGAVAEMPRVATPPPAVSAFTRIQTGEAIDPTFAGRLRPPAPIPCRVTSGQDLAFGHALMFATFVEIMDRAERALVVDHVFPPFPTELLPHLAVIEREIYYLNNCYGDQELMVDIRGALSPCRADTLDKGSDSVAAGLLTCVMSLYQRGTNNLLAASRTTKLLAIPSSRKTLLRDAERLVSHHGEQNNDNRQTT